MERHGFDVEPTNPPDEWDRVDRILDSLDRAIFEAIEGDEEGAVARILDANGDLLREYPGLLSDHLEPAVERGRIGAVAALLGAGALPSRANESGGTPLMAAAWHEQREIARLLLEAGADPDALLWSDNDVIQDPSRAGRCALYFALIKENPDLVELLEAWTSPEARALAEQAARREFDREPVLSPLVRRLFRAVERDDAQEVVAVLAEGIDPECSNRDGETPLALAATRDRPLVVTALLDGGAGIDAPGNLRGQTPLALAVRANAKSVLALLLAAGANPEEATDEQGRTVWEMAARYGMVEALRQAWREGRGTEPPA